jgi:hypothetical protein
MGDNTSEDEKSYEEKCLPLDTDLEKEDDGKQDSKNPRPKKTKPWYDTHQRSPTKCPQFITGSKI